MARQIEALAVIFCTLSWILGAGLPARAQSAEVDLELVLAVDCSSSVDDVEYRLQMQGLARAFSHPSVLHAIQSYTTRGLVVTLVQWAGAGSERQVIGWTKIAGPKDALHFAQALATTQRSVTGATATGDVIDYSTELLLANEWRGRRLVIDVSGDGRPNEGEAPPFARARATRLGVVINGLAILNEEPTLDRYYAIGVVGGPGSFLEVANDFSAFEEAIKRKLRQEISGIPISSAN
jgi:hypothetical protein